MNSQIVLRINPTIAITWIRWAKQFLFPCDTSSPSKCEKAIWKSQFMRKVMSITRKNILKIQELSLSLFIQAMLWLSKISCLSQRLFVWKVWIWNSWYEIRIQPKSNMLVNFKLLRKYHLMFNFHIWNENRRAINRYSNYYLMISYCPMFNYSMCNIISSHQFCCALSHPIY